ncbi:MAG: hypothetical protein NC213_08270 [Acetobacter sp.]|nr:hypothetical protein [Bacteroides sp.]MCM1341724.1 hypothetical protein [Acetobacter sp.]MCM1432337.1 hypothetical protein [Clostridiales bacterium]
MTDYNSVFEQLMVILGCAQNELADFENHINSSIEYVQSILTDKEKADDLRIINLCAAAAAVKIAVIKDVDSDDISSFSAGDVSYTKDTSPIDRLKALYEIARNECGAMIYDNAFSFEAV